METSQQSETVPYDEQSEQKNIRHRQVFLKSYLYVCHIMQYVKYLCQGNMYKTK